MDEKHHVQWAKAIMQGDPYVTIEQPPRTLYLHWTKVQGPITEFSKKPKQQAQREEMKQHMTEFKDSTKTVMQQMQEMQEMQTRQSMQEMMKDNIERQNARMEKKKQHCERLEHQREQREQFEFMKVQESMRMQPSMHHTSSHQAYLPIMQPYSHATSVDNTSDRQVSPILSLPPPAPRTIPSAIPPILPLSPSHLPPSTRRPRSSSPIEPTQHESQTVKEFFDWKIQRTTYEPTIRKLRLVQQIVEDKEFKFKHLKAMSDSTTPMHQRALDLGISDGMALDFAQDLCLFKVDWHLAKELLNMRRGGVD
ncbi:hypothetical protein MMC07_009934 [Pseudocyphellaria aurata]|nr:hypothetical protein [Pseudocyphellaria aurata]